MDQRGKEIFQSAEHLVRFQSQESNGNIEENSQTKKHEGQVIKECQHEGHEHAQRIRGSGDSLAIKIMLQS